MMKFKNKTHLIILFLLINIGIVYAQSDLPLNATTIDNRNVYVGLYLLNLGKFDIATGSFTADFYLSLKCDSECPLYEFEFMNGRAASFEKIIDKPNEKFFRIQANLVSPIDLKKFPFDKQKLQIIIEDKRKTIEELNYIPNLEESGIDDSIIFIGWNIDNWKAYTKEHIYEVYGETYSQYIFDIQISRILINAIFKTFLPIIFIILIMLSSFVLDPDKITTRLTMVGSALVASVMFHVSLVNQIPHFSYLTFIDKFMVLSYFVILLSFLFNVFLLELHEQKKDKLVKKLHKSTEFTMFIFVPLLYILLFVFFL
ncbi:MAG: hypothetical protein N3D84_01595 [Candidatus Woesearchaeota archaeon]|nr:hypothetical protein [Candidatus Woesearchaeota archaeon]